MELMEVQEAACGIVTRTSLASALAALVLKRQRTRSTHATAAAICRTQLCS